MKNRLSNKSIAIIGIVMYLLSVLTSIEIRENYIFPLVLRLAVELCILAFIIVAISRLWKEVRIVALVLLASIILVFVLGIIQESGILNVLVLFNLTKLIVFIAFLWVVITLLQNGEINSFNSQQGIILRKDKEWSLIDGDLCLVTDFIPLAGSIVKNGTAMSQDVNTPYASVALKNKGTAEKIAGFITHKIDFANLWEVFKERGINKEKEEVLIYWSTKHYSNIIFRMFSFIMLSLLGATPLPKIFVMIFPKGTYDKSTSDSKLPREINARVFIYGLMPIKCWIPDSM
jgi:hypothetical protein